jgi:hypothetical protein
MSEELKPTIEELDKRTEELLQRTLVLKEKVKADIKMELDFFTEEFLKDREKNK